METFSEWIYSCYYIYTTAKNNLKLVTVSQYLKDVSHGNCDEDERELLSGFLDVIQKP